MSPRCEVTVGAFMRKQVRNLIEEARFLGHKVEYHESKSWIESHFIIRGDEAAIKAIHDALAKYASETA